MFFLTEKMLIWSMRLGKRRGRVLKAAGRILGMFPVWYAERMEKRLMDGTWNPGPKWKKRAGREETEKNRDKYYLLIPVPLLSVLL